MLTFEQDQLSRTYSFDLPTLHKKKDRSSLSLKSLDKKKVYWIGVVLFNDEGKICEYFREKKSNEDIYLESCISYFSSFNLFVYQCG